MTKYEQEIKNRFGAKMLANMKADYKAGFHIVGETDKVVMVGNGSKSSEYSRKTGKQINTYIHAAARKTIRKIN